MLANRLLSRSAGCRPAIRPIAAVAAFTFFFAVCVSAAKAGRPQSVALDLRAENGGTTLHTFSFGQPYAINPDKLHFIARRHGVADAPATRLTTKIGFAAFVTPDPRVSRTGKGLDEYKIPLRFEPAPGMAGLYDVELTADPGFAWTASGPLAIGDWSTSQTVWRWVFWWPPATAEAGLTDLRHRIVGKDTYWFGGIALGCASWSKGYGPTVPVRVRAVEREVGQVVQLGTGSTMRWGSGPSFFAYDPLRIVLENPSAPWLFSGGGGWGGAAADNNAECPAVVLADWQVGSMLTTSAPPPGIKGPVTIGMSRGETAWVAGYPTGFDTLTAMQRAGQWYYEGGPRFSQSFDFTDDRVVSIGR